EDFYYRIRVFEIRLPPLRERREDIPLLVAHFIDTIARRTGSRVKGIASEALQALGDHAWSGNVRELHNVLEQAFVTAEGDHLRMSDLPPEIQQTPLRPAARPAADEDDERARITQALEKSGGRKAEAARRLGISRVTLWKRMAKFGIEGDGVDTPAR
ncbi:MAG TPA: helix-turn-helix domain-containing protein, partial [Planctomycetota bacterium]|nr:helix-turn-helix domain-containing protein [Planctomycetota bacterium]